jgi:hypothetical protein
MNKLRLLLCAGLIVTLFSCEKEYSIENSGPASELIVGLNCRISKITFLDTAATGDVGLGFIGADINTLDVVTKVTQFDSTSNTIVYINSLTYSNDTVFIDADQYFITDVNKRIVKLHTVLDPTDPFSLQYEVFYVYNTAGFLINKNYFLVSAPTTMFYQVTYSYSGGNLTFMKGVDQVSGEVQTDADVDYQANIIPRSYLYVFPDTDIFPPYFNQFLNFGIKNYNAVKKITVRNYDPGNVVRDSAVSTFTNYIMSRDGYVLSTQMGGDDQQSIPAVVGKLKFSYHCK